MNPNGGTFALPASGVDKLELLIERCREHGDAEARDDLVTIAANEFRHRAHHMLAHYPRLRRWEETSDVLQLALMRLHRALDGTTVRSAKHFYALATLQIRRTLIDLSRRYFGALGHGTQCTLELGYSDGASADDSDVSYWSLHDWSLFHEAVSELDPIYREPFEIIWYHERKPQDLCDVLDITEQTVRRRYKRACQLIGQRLGLASQMARQQQPWQGKTITR